MPDAKFYMLSFFLISIISIFNEVNYRPVFIEAPNQDKYSNSG